MPVIPTFSSYAQTPNLAQAYLGGQEIQVARERIAQQAAEAANRIAMEREQLNAQMVATEMEWAARKDIEAKKALQQAQEFEIQKAYQQTQLGISQRNLEREDLSLKLKLAEAADQFERDATWKREHPKRTAAGIAAGKSPEQASIDATRSLMLEFGGPGVATALNPPNPPRERTYPVVVGTNLDRTDITVPMTLSQFQSWDQTAPPNLKAKAANAAIRKLQPPTSMTGTNALAGRTNAITIIGRRRSQ